MGKFKSVIEVEVKEEKEAYTYVLLINVFLQNVPKLDQFKLLKFLQSEDYKS